MAKVTVNGLQLHYQRLGQGADVILVHGVTGNMSTWYGGTLQALSRETRVTIYDHKGHGYSDFAPSGYTSDALAVDLIGLMDALEIPQAHLLGFSYGGPIAMQAAARYPERVRSVVVVDAGFPALRHLNNLDTWPYFDEYKKQMRERYAKFGLEIPDDKWDDLDWLFKQSATVPIQFGMRKGHQRDTGRLHRLLYESTVLEDIRKPAGLTEEMITAVEQPTLLVYGEKTNFIGTYEYLKENMRNVTPRLVPGRGHYLVLKPFVMTAYALEFWRSLEAAAEPSVSEAPESTAVLRPGAGRPRAAAS